jgi:eukaryotic-like serine/threonine-protein kinase
MIAAVTAEEEGYPPDTERDEAPTIVTPMKSGRSGTSGRPAWVAMSSQTTVSPIITHGGTAAPSASLATSAAVREEQATRGGAIVRVGVVVSLVALVAIQLPANQVLIGRIAASGALAVIFLTSLALLVLNRRGRRMEPSTVFGLGLVITPSLVVVTAHVGAFSPATLAFVFGIYYFGMSDAKHEGWACWGISAAGHALLTALTFARVLPPERSMLALAPPDPVGIAAMAVVVQLFFAATFWLARLTRGATVKAMTQLERAQRQIRERDALLDEANQDLQQALGAQKKGRFSGKRLGPFQAEELIGRGAMGDVYTARHAETGDPAALKVLHAFMLESETHVERFFREAEISSSLDSPHIVKVHGQGVADDGSPFLAMELLHGHDLAWHLRQRHRFAMKDALELIAQLAQALAAAQDAGIVHRDLKPKNVFYDERPIAPGTPGVWKVLDFGVSKMRASSGTLSHGAIIGTPGYMAPEQARAQVVDHRADVFSLAAIAYRVLTGAPPFTGTDFMSTMYQVAHDQPPRPGSLASLSADLDRMLALGLAKDRDRRIRSATSFAAGLRDAARGELDERFREDADKLIEDHPWGERRVAS